MKNFFITAVFLAGIAGLQFYFDIQQPKRPEIPPLLLPASSVRMGDLGLHSAAAGYFWISTIQNITAPGSRYKSALPEYLDLVNNLDPRFSYPYAFGTLVLAEASPEEAVKIGERGMREAGSDWRIPYYLATTYHIFLEDRASAARYFDLAAQVSGASESVIRVAATYGGSSSRREQSKAIWNAIFETSDDEVVVERAKLYLVHYEFLDALEKAVTQYKQKMGQNPDNLRDLVGAKILKEIPLSPFGLEYKLRSDGEVGF